MSEEVTLQKFAARPEETERLGEELGRILPPNTLVLLFGNLGAGKTTFSRGLGRGLEIPTPIQSPTFALVYEHRGRLPLAHMDFYRLDKAVEVESLGLDEYLESGGVTLIEWPEIALDRLPEDRIEIRLEPEGTGRSLQFRAVGDAAKVLEEWSERTSSGE